MPVRMSALADEPTSTASKWSSRLAHEPQTSRLASRRDTLGARQTDVAGVRRPVDDRAILLLHSDEIEPPADDKVIMQRQHDACSIGVSEMRQRERKPKQMVDMHDVEGMAGKHALKMQLEFRMHQFVLGERRSERDPLELRAGGIA